MSERRRESLHVCECEKKRERESMCERDKEREKVILRRSTCVVTLV